jgi:DHA3 family tetracycline resistance protein-like MFS transporter
MNRLKAYPIYLTMSAAHGLFFALIVTVNMVYQATVVGLNPFQLVMVGTVLELTCLLFEIPTGVVADAYSRRLSVIIGYVLVGLGFMVEGLFPFFGTVLLAQVIWGIGATFLSGASEAWIADETSHANNGSEAALGQTYLRGTQASQLGGLAGIGLSVALASITITLPIVLGGALFVGLALFLILFMPEHGFSPTPKEERNSWQVMGQTFRQGVGLVKAKPILITILVISALVGMNSEGLDRLWTAHMLENFTFPALGQLKPVVWFGIIEAVGMLLTLGAAEIVRRRVNTESQQAVVRALMAITSLFIVSLILFGLATNFVLAVGAIWLVGVFRTMAGPLYMAWTNQHIESKVRATILSMSGQTNAIGQIAGGPAVGAIGTIFSLRAALVTAALLLTPALGLYAKTLRPTTPAAELAVSEG